MAYDFGDGDLLGTGSAEVGSAASEDPRVGLVNLADVMLVFACGLMLALVTFWNLDLPTITELNSTDMKPLENVEEMIDAATNSQAYIERGRVYQDPVTGKLYWMVETTEGGSDGGGGASGGEALPEAPAGTLPEAPAGAPTETPVPAPTEEP